VTVVERCSGHDGTWGVKVEHYEASMAIGRRLFRAVEEMEPDVVVSDCSLAGGRIGEGTGKVARHPIEVFAEACGLEE
ncbi:MAG: Fe-S oxidoreductase, partial [Dehalococcoidia bacterium]